MMKIKLLIYGIIVVLLFGGIFYFRTILEVTTPSTAPRSTPEVARSQSNTSRVNEAQSQGPIGDLTPTRQQSASPSKVLKISPLPYPRRDGHGHREEQAGTVSLPSPKRRPARTDLTELEQREAEEQHLLEEQLDQETAADDEARRSPEQPRAFADLMEADLTELEQREAEEQHLLEEQLEQETAADDEARRSPEQPRAFADLMEADLTELEQREAEEQHLLEEQLEQETAADDEAGRSPTAAPRQP